jgi:adenylate cyclase
VGAAGVAAMPAAIRFGRIEVRPDQRQVLVDGLVVAIAARAYDVLWTLIEHRDRVFTKGELLDVVWPGLMVEEHNLHTHVSLLRKLIGANAIATVPGRGYRFVACLDSDLDRAAPAGSGRPMRASTGADQPLPDKPSIAILPFTYMHGEPEQEYFADGITEDIITELARFRDLCVIARNSSFTYKGKAVDVRTVAKDLGIRYVLEGSTRKGVGRIRVTGQLVDALNGNHLWAEKYDRTLDDIFAVQEELTHRIVTAIAPHIQASELQKARRRRPDSIIAYEIATCARSKAWEAYNRADRNLRDEAISDARAALAIDPRSTVALTSLAQAQWQHVAFGTAADPQAAFADGIAASTRAIELDPSETLGYATKGLLLAYAPDRDRSSDALQNLRRANELNPHDTQILTALGFGEAMAGDPHRAIARLEPALRLKPRDMTRHTVLQVLTICCLCAREYAKGVEYGSQGIDEFPAAAGLHGNLAMCLVGLGEIAKAKAALEEERRVAPELVRKWLAGGLVYRKAEDLLRYRTFVRIAAGVEDPSAADSLR